MYVSTSLPSIFPGNRRKKHSLFLGLMKWEMETYLFRQVDGTLNTSLFEDCVVQDHGDTGTNSIVSTG
ncbi:hypothetical protein KDW_50450 [Dictyobacter vulcani]|uniref:Uncharacterized protein n=1 Tax=Dictyobacter vulcani TaxID=2607529 RepID=A0A5J4KT84_9CHLR|nr:hypothetical protein KDW_50450 [Dictyobacter vulcani]